MFPSEKDVGCRRKHIFRPTEMSRCKWTYPHSRCNLRLFQKKKNPKTKKKQLEKKKPGESEEESLNEKCKNDCCEKAQ